MQVRLYQPAVSAGHQGVAERRGHHLGGRVRVPTQIPEQVRYISYTVSLQESRAQHVFTAVKTRGPHYFTKLHSDHFIWTH